jgi:Ca2+-binding EF-hand superfamily protein
VFENIDLDRDGAISHREMDFGIRTVNNSMLSNSEVDYVNTVLETRGTPEIDFQAFAVICALSERVNALDHMVRHKVNKMDITAMEHKMRGCKDMFYLLDEKDDGFVEMEMLVREVRAGR